MVAIENVSREFSRILRGFIVLSCTPPPSDEAEMGCLWPLQLKQPALLAVRGFQLKITPHTMYTAPHVSVRAGRGWLRDINTTVCAILTATICVPDAPIAFLSNSSVLQRTW